MPKREMVVRPKPLFRILEVTLNDAFNLQMGSATAFATSASFAVNDAKRIGFFYNMSGTAVGSIDLTFSMQASWAAGQPFYDVLGESGQSSAVHTDTSTPSGRNYVWWNVTAPIIRFKVEAAAAAGERVTVRDIRGWVQT